LVIFFLVSHKRGEDRYLLDTAMALLVEVATWRE